MRAPLLFTKKTIFFKGKLHNFSTLLLETTFKRDFIKRKLTMKLCIPKAIKHFYGINPKTLFREYIAAMDYTTNDRDKKYLFILFLKLLRKSSTANINTDPDIQPIKYVADPHYSLYKRCYNMCQTFIRDHRLTYDLLLVNDRAARRSRWLDNVIETITMKSLKNTYLRQWLSQNEPNQQLFHAFIAQRKTTIQKENQKIFICLYLFEWLRFYAVNVSFLSYDRPLVILVKNKVDEDE